MGNRNRASGWKYAKISGHKNESIIESLMNSDEKYQKAFLNKIGNPNSVIKHIETGGIYEKDVECIFEEKKTKSKTDMKVFLDDGSTYNISIKKSLGGQVYLISDSRFIEGFEKQYNIEIPSAVKRGIQLFWGSASDTKDLIDKYGTKKNYEYRKNRLVADTIKKYDSNLYTILLNWFAENTYLIADFCFSKGLACNKYDWADFIWYKNELGENKIDDIFSIHDLCSALQEIAMSTTSYGTRNRRNNNSDGIWICSMA